MNQRDERARARADQRIAQLEQENLELIGLVRVLRNENAALQQQLLDDREVNLRATRVIDTLKVVYRNLNNESGLKREFIKIFIPAFETKQEAINFWDCSSQTYYNALNTNLKILSARYPFDVKRKRVTDERATIFINWYNENFPVQSGRTYHLQQCTDAEVFVRYFDHCAANQLYSISRHYAKQNIFSKMQIRHVNKVFLCPYCCGEIIDPGHDLDRKDAHDYLLSCKAQIIPIAESRNCAIVSDWADISWSKSASVQILFLTVYRNQVLSGLERADEYYAYICPTGNQQHNYRQVMSCFTHFMQYIPYERDGYDRFSFISDNGNHFRCSQMFCYFFYLIRMLISKDIRCEINYRAPHHGNGPCDTAAAWIQRSITLAQKNQNRYFQNRDDVKDFIIEQFPHFHVFDVPRVEGEPMQYVAYVGVNHVHHIKWYEWDDFQGYTGCIKLSRLNNQEHPEFDNPYYRPAECSQNYIRQHFPYVLTLQN